VTERSTGVTYWKEPPASKGSPCGELTGYAGKDVPGSEEPAVPGGQSAGFPFAAARDFAPFSRVSSVTRNVFAFARPRYT
jgi:hypothetical protein